MTARDTVMTEFKSLRPWIVCGCASFLFGHILFLTVHWGFYFLTLTGLALIMRSNFYIWQRIKCPQCGNPVGLQFWGTILWQSRKLQFCPFCALDFDTELEQRSQSGRPD